jgi:hypothetical protein
MNTIEQIKLKLQFLSEFELKFINHNINKIKYDCFNNFDEYLTKFVPLPTISECEESNDESDLSLFSVEYDEELDYERDMKEFNFTSVDEIVKDMNNYDTCNFFKKFNDIENCMNIFNGQDGHCCYNCGSFVNHNCCMICKKNRWDCNCEFNCGIMRPMPVKNGHGYIVKFEYEKCNSVDIFHTCQGYARDGKVFVKNNNEKILRSLWE